MVMGVLLLAARELIRQVMRPAFEPHAGEGAQGALAAGALAESLSPWGQLDVRHCRLARQKVERLEHEPDFRFRSAANASSELAFGGLWLSTR